MMNYYLHISLYYNDQCDEAKINSIIYQYHIYMYVYIIIFPCILERMQTIFPMQQLAFEGIDNIGIVKFL